MGSVYRAHDRHGRVVDLQWVPLPETSRDDAGRARIAAAAAAWTALQHPGLVHPLEIIPDGDGLWIVWPAPEGTALERRLQAGAAWAPADAARLVAALAEALQCAHDHGLIHGDVSPANVFLDEADRPRLGGFAGPALAALAGRPGSGADGGVSGTAGYVAPELLTAGADLSDPRRDLYALGVLLYVLLTGRKPFEGIFAAIAKQVTATGPKRPGARKRGIPRDLDTICMKALERDPAARYASAAALAEALRTFLGAVATAPERRRGFWR
jgi:serine/threonine protein kinase